MTTTTETGRAAEVADSQPDRIRSVLRFARRREEGAQRNAADAERQRRHADEDAVASNRRLEELDDAGPTTADDFRRRRQRAALRADQARLAEEQLREMLHAELEARELLRGAVRRRRSLEELEGRRLATQAGLAAHAAQRALDELAALRRRGADDDR